MRASASGWGDAVCIFDTHRVEHKMREVFNVRCDIESGTRVGRVAVLRWLTLTLTCDAIKFVNTSAIYTS